MALSRGTKLGAYEVIGPIGAGGMGEVYRARDTRLQRDVAIKVLPDLQNAEPERLARMAREAQALAALNHPNIAQIHGLEESGGVRALVMELVEGEDLSTLIARGPMPFAEARPIARQIAEALESAHEQGIVHRDLKPANVKVRQDGTVKVLDFGLAKITDPLSSASGGRGDLALSPTLTAQATRAGVILGTAAYMSPEQARGRMVDRRADVWAFGVVLYEMLTGRRAFEGEDISITLANVLKEDVDWRALPADLPPPTRRLLRRCLDKDPRRRLSAMGDARLELDDSLARDADAGAATTAAARGRRGVTIAIGLAIAAGAALLTAGVMRAWAPTAAPAPAPGVTRLAIALPEGAEVTETNRLPLALSPDGTMLAYIGRHEGGVRQLYLKRLGDRDPIALQDTDGAISPFFSPDGQWIAFFAQGKIKRIAVGGAALQIVASEVPDPRGGTWTDDGQIYFTPTNTSGLYKVPAAGGAATPVTKLDPEKDEISHRWPEALPGGRSLLFTVWTGPGSDERRIVVQSLESGERHALVPGGDSA
ncbi:MAG TPA: protein kinase, partial [Candidatus Polarisedimenticolia bacterium]|nr:protein kinase [Candidatus Polarisedimenticolia bacterium]